MNSLLKFIHWLSLFRRVDLTQDNSAVDGQYGWHTSLEEQYLSDVEDVIWERLERVRVPVCQPSVDAHRRKLIWKKGKTFSVVQTVNHLHRLYPHYPTHIIESGVLCWLEENSGPENVTQVQMDTHDRLIEQWIIAYEKGRSKLQNTIKKS